MYIVTPHCPRPQGRGICRDHVYAESSTAAFNSMTSQIKELKCKVDMQQRQDIDPVQDNAEASTYSNLASSTQMTYRVYKRRWYMLATCSLLNFSSGMVCACIHYIRQ